MKHPAVYSDAFLPIFKEWLSGSKRVLDPFGGTGKLKQVRPDAICMDIELEWAKDLQADAMHLPFPSKSFDAICTSPTYGNRMADKFVDGTHRITYTNYLGHRLHDHNTGQLQWGPRYKALHYLAWAEAARVLHSDGLFILNVKDHIRAGRQVHVTDWHMKSLMDLGFIPQQTLNVKVSGNGYGKNREKRVAYETLLVFILR